MIWITTEDAAKLSGKDVSTFQKAIKSGKYIAKFVSGKGRGGKQLQIALESLPQKMQDRYYGIQAEINQRFILSLTDTQRSEVCEKEGIVSAYKDFKSTYPKADKMKAFLMQYNGQHPDKTLSKRQLNHWETLFERDGIAGLVDRRGGYNKGQSTIPKEVQDVFFAYWMQEKGTKCGGPSVASCYRLTQYTFPALELPSVDAFERLTQSIPLPAKIYAREGKKAFDDKCMPHMIFDYRSIHTNEQWVGDNHVFDVLVKDNSGRVFRPWVVGWMDRCSRTIVGFHVIEHDPNSDAILDAFAKAVKDFAIPEGVLLDNGKDFTVNDLFNPTFIKSLVNEMVISVTNAIKFNAKAKPIERFFNTLEYSYCIHLPSYIGSDPKRRPEALKKLNEKLKDVAMPYTDFVAFIEGVIAKYNNTPHSGDGMNGQTPFQAFVSNITIPLRTADETLLSMYFKRTTRLLTVGRNGVRVPELQQYYDAKELFEYQGQKIYVKYNTNDVRQVYCITEEGEHICTAVSSALGTLDKELTAQNMRLLNSKKKERRQAIKKYLPDAVVPSIERVALDWGLSFDKPNLKVLDTMQTVNSTQHRKAKAMLVSDEKLHKERAGLISGSDQLDEDEAYFKFMTGG